MIIFRINCTTQKDRHAVIKHASVLIEKNGGWIVDFKMFSNKSICLNIEVPACKIQALFDDLHSSMELTLTQDSKKEMEALAGGLEIKTAASDMTAFGTFQIMFFNDDPDIRIICPAVPG